MSGGGGAEGGEGDSPPSSEPDAGLDPRTPGSGPEPKAVAQRLSHPGAPLSSISLSVRT